MIPSMSQESRRLEIQYCVEWQEGESLRFGRAKVELRPLSEGGYILESFEKMPGITEHLNHGEALLHAGFFDSHLHTFWSGQYQQSVVGDRFSTSDAYFDALKKRQEESNEWSPSSPLKSFAVDEARWGCRFDQLRDQAAEALGSREFWILYRVCGHAAIVSEPVARLLDSNLSGVQIFEDKELFPLSAKLEKSFEEEVLELKKHFLVAQKSLLAMGISSVGDMSLEGPMLQALEELAAEGQLRIHHQGVLIDDESTKSVLPYSRTVQLSGEEYLLECLHWKRYLDGSFGSQTAALLEPYKSNSSENRGTLHYEDNELFEAAAYALERGFALSFHAIGDAAFEQVLRLSAELKPQLQKRADQAGFAIHRIEHAQLVNQQQLEKLEQEFPFWTLVIQPLHEVADSHFAEDYLGAERRHRDMYRLRSFLDRKLPVSVGSDAPVVSADPLKTLKACQMFQNSDERISLEKALELYLFSGRKAHRMPTESLSEGKRVFVLEDLKSAN